MPQRTTSRHGTVTSFDERAGHGTVTGDGDDEAVFFHCTRIADGSRTIPVGIRAVYGLEPLGIGQWEAVDVRPDSGV